MILYLLAAGLLIALSGSARGANRGEGIPPDSWPASWFAPPQTASGMGITAFRESPLLAERVARGALPPLRKRLPDDPYVIEPAERIGRYGGTMRVFDRDAGLVTGLENPLTMDPLVRDVLPNLASGWTYSDGGKVFTLFLRPGMKWSDGHPFTSGDFVFWYRHILLNRDLTPVIRPRLQGMQLTAPDPYTVLFTFPRPYAFLVQELAHHGDGFFAPAHFMQRFHPDFTDRQELEARADREGFISWMAYFNAVKGNAMTEPTGVPTMNAFVLTRKSPTLLVYERNPFYPKIDPAGNQLPYIDRIMVQVVKNAEVVTAKTSTGQADFSGNGLNTADIPLFKLGEKTNAITTLIWNRLHGVDVVIQPNLTCEDAGLRAIFRDVRFRRALSLAINRDEINAIVYFGRATPRQTTVIPSSVFYEEAFAAAHIAYDPETARRLLDGMGLVDRDGDGLRERADGAPLSITLEWVDIETPKGMTMELVTEYWRKVGIEVHLKQVDGGLQSSRARANLMQMTLWHADRTSDILFPPEPFWFVPMHTGWEECHWTLWSNWYLFSGQEGEKPPPEIQQLVAWWEEMNTTMDASRRVELGKNILRSQAENLWTIGTLGLAPQPVVISNALQNVPARGYWGWDNRWTLPYHPETWFLE
jgi:peptide/nickel transport system substrate-binding protein